MSAATAASLVGVISIANGLGRVFWAWISDLTGRKTAFIMMYLIQAVLFWTFHSIGSAALLFVVTFIIVVCYGGGYGITPAFTADYFGARNMGAVYGLMLLPWAFPAAFGPLLFAYLRQVTGGYNQALYLIAGMMTVSMILPVLVSPPRGHKTTDAAPVGGVAFHAVSGVDRDA